MTLIFLDCLLNSIVQLPSPKRMKTDKHLRGSGKVENITKVTYSQTLAEEGLLFAEYNGINNSKIIIFQIFISE